MFSDQSNILKELLPMSNLSHFNKNFNHLNIFERKLIQKLHSDGVSVSCIANLLGRHRSTISRQLSNRKNLDFLKVKGKVVRTYSAVKAQDNYSKNKSNCGAKYKLFQDTNLIKYINDCVVNKKWSPEVAIGRANLVGWNFKIHISAKTIYNYIDRNQINISPFDLRFKLRRKKPKKQYIKQNKKKLGKSIEIRPEYINDRSEFGHWEGDTVVDKNCNSILVLQERTSRKGILLKLKRHTSEEVNRQLQILKNKYGGKFKKIFKTITFDNGSEFYKTIEFENDSLQIYFTHPYCSYEKGGVENLNGIIRRYLPKNKNLKEITRQKLKAINEQIDNTPRKILNYQTPKEYFEEKCMLAI